MPAQKKKFSRGTTPIERIFHKVMGRKMNEAERHYLLRAKRKPAA